MCEYCEGNKLLLSSTLESVDDVILFGLKDTDTVSVATIKQWYEEVAVDVEIDRGHLVLWEGEDRGCLDHAEDRIQINYCPVCGDKLC